jgi:predicted small integral membrane protein
MAARETGVLARALRVAGVDLARRQPVSSRSPGHWMAWTWTGVAFFGAIACGLIAMTLWQGLRPQAPRVGVLGLETTPGDRFFISLLGSAFIHLGWLAAFGAPLWGALALSLVYAAAVFRWV